MINQISLKNIIAPAFFKLHKDIKNHRHTHYSIKGGRGSAKSSFIAIEIILLLKAFPDMHAVIFRKIAATLRDSVYAQMLWAISILQLHDEFFASLSPLQITYIPTGQRIIFRGADDPDKIKSLKVPFGYIGITHFEELDQFSGRDEIRQILETTMRGGDIYFNFESFNPPASVLNWVNLDSLYDRQDRLIHHSDYRSVPKNWLGTQFFREAELLEKSNERAYLHEYLGEITGTGAAVFENLSLQTISSDNLPFLQQFLFGIDWGWFPDPTAFVKCAFDKKSRRLFILDEFAVHKTNTAGIANLLTEHRVSFDDLIICDNSDNKSVADLREHGFLAKSASKGAGSLSASMKWLQSLQAIIIDNSKCPGCAREFQCYEYGRTKDGEIIPAFPDKNNHFIDAVRYATNLIWTRP